MSTDIDKAVVIEKILRQYGSVEIASDFDRFYERLKIAEDNVKALKANAHYGCDLCGMPLFQLQPHDFWLGVCFNHEPPRFCSRPWCNPEHNESRSLREWELEEIMRRFNSLKQRLTVVSTPKEIIAVVGCFEGGGGIPNIDERITRKKGEHL